MARKREVLPPTAPLLYIQLYSSERELTASDHITQQNTVSLGEQATHKDINFVV